MKVLFAALCLALGLPNAALAADGKATDPKAAKPRPYLLKMCLVSDEKLDPGDPVILYQGREIIVCCEGCKKDFAKDPEKYLKLIDAAEKKLAAEQAKKPKK